MPSKRISTTKLLSLIMSMSSVLSYSVSPHGPHAKPFGVQDFPSVKVKDERVRQRPTYDLGLGKNKPLYGGKRHTISNDPARFMVEHEGVNPLPSPLQTTASEPISDQAPKKKRVLPKVQLERKSADVLNIDHRSQDSLPHMTTTQSAVKMDLNTAWVEMLIHSEQMKPQIA